MKKLEFKELINIIKESKSIILTTHKMPDGDGLGCEAALFHGLKQMGKNVKIVGVDKPPVRYKFLKALDNIELYEEIELQNEWDLSLILDTNDRRLLNGLFNQLKENSKHVLFIDHHPLLEDGPQPDAFSLLDETAASTGEIVYRLLKELDVEFNDDIAEALYTSIAFDTQVFKQVRDTSTSHLIGAELLKYEFDSQLIHKNLFANYKKNKAYFLSDIIKKIEFFENDKYAFLSVHENLLKEHGLVVDEVLDVVDFVAGINPVQIAVYHRENKDLTGKLSFRSNNNHSVRPLAESLGGGGHKFAAGAPVVGSAKDIKAKIHERVLELLD